MAPDESAASRTAYRRHQDPRRRFLHAYRGRGPQSSGDCRCPSWTIANHRRGLHVGSNRVAGGSSSMSNTRRSDRSSCLGHHSASLTSVTARKLKPPCSATGHRRCWEPTMPALMYGSTRTHQWNRGRLGRPIVVFYLADVGDHRTVAQSLSARAAWAAASRATVTRKSEQLT
jgi:hypothetical protein